MHVVFVYFNEKAKQVTDAVIIIINIFTQLHRYWFNMKQFLLCLPRNKVQFESATSIPIEIHSSLFISRIF